MALGGSPGSEEEGPPLHASAGPQQRDRLSQYCWSALIPLPLLTVPAKVQQDWPGVPSGLPETLPFSPGQPPSRKDPVFSRDFQGPSAGTSITPLGLTTKFQTEANF